MPAPLSCSAFPPAAPSPRRRFVPSALALAAALLLAGHFPLPAQAQTAPAAIDIPAQPLGAALNELARQARLQLLVAPELVAGKTAPPVQGRLAPEAALKQLLAGSGLEAVAQGGSLVVRRIPDPGAAAVQTLPAVQVVAAGDPALPAPYAGGQVARGARLGMLGNADFMSTPFNITSYTEKNLEDQQVRSMAGALQNDPSVRVSSTNSTHNEAFMIRGFEIFTPDIAINGLYGLLPQHRVVTEFAERVEVLKGPSALLGGITPNGSVGGGINIVTKRAEDQPLTRLSAGFISDGQATTHADIGRRFGDNKEFGVRVNGVYRNGDTAMDGQSQQLAMGSLGLDYRGERLRVSLDAIRQNEHLDGGAEFGVRFSSTIPAAPDASTIFLPGTFSHTDNKTILARAEYDITPDLTVYGSGGKLKSERLVGLGVPVANPAGAFSAAVQQERRYFDNASYDAGVRGRFETGTVRHQVVASLSGFETETGFSQTVGPAVASNIYNPVPVLQPATSPTSMPKTGESRMSSYALADTLSLAGERALLTLGARRQQVKNNNFNPATGALTTAYDQSATTPMAGLVLKPLTNLSLYANYIEGLTQGPVAPTTPGILNPGQAFAPMKTKQVEVGAKLDIGRLAGTLSLFQISKPNSLTTAAGLFTVDGEQRNRGIELNLFGAAAKGVRVLGGATYTDAKVTAAADPALTGKDAIGVPGFQLNLGAEWDLPALPGLSLSARGLYTGSQYANAANTQKLPDWTRFDIGARYVAVIGGKPVVLRANIENLFDRNYWSGVYGGGFVSLGAPRTFVLSATVDF